MHRRITDLFAGDLRGTSCKKRWVLDNVCFDYGHSRNNSFGESGALLLPQTISCWTIKWNRSDIHNTGSDLRTAENSGHKRSHCAPAYGDSTENEIWLCKCTNLVATPYDFFFLFELHVSSFLFPVLCFHLPTNLRTIGAMANDGEIDFLHGFRVLSMWWIVSFTAYCLGLVHTYIDFADIGSYILLGHEFCR